MYCGECGTKNEKNAKFCESCGAKLVAEKVSSKTEDKKSNTSSEVPKKTFSEKIKEMSKRNKIIALVAIIVVVAFVVFYVVVGGKLKPTAIAEDYFLAAVEQDAAALYEYLDIEKSDFTTKDMFVNITKEDDAKEIKIANYTVGEAKKDKLGLSTTVTVTYFLEDSKDPETMDITLIKQKKKKYGIFDNWKVSIDGEATVEDFKIKVLKDSKVKIEGVEVDKKYLDKESSNDTYDVYKMPVMFKETYSAVITLPYGFDVEDDIRVSSYSSYTYSFNKDQLPEKVEESIKNTVKNGLQAMYDGAKDKKSFDDVKKNFEYTNADLDDVKEKYEDLVDGLDGKGLTSIKFDKVELSSFRTYSDDTFYAYVKVTYDYTVSYDENGETKTHDGKDKYTYLYVYFDYADGEFKINNFGSLNTYFSKYY